MGYKPWLSVIGVYNYDPTIFKAISLPTDYNLSHDTLVRELLREAGELPLVYHDPDVLKEMLTHWSISKQYGWAKMAATLNLSYDPIANYDRHERWVESGGTTDTETNSGSDKGVTNASGKDSVAAFNADSLTPQSSTDTEGESTTTYGRVTTTQRVYNNYTREGEAKGNIGVTTTQRMIREEREIADFSLYTVIVQQFINDFCVVVW